MENNEEPLSPPYWQTRLQHNSTLGEPATVQKPNSGTIRLEDHTEETADNFKALWAKSVRIDDFTLVGQGTAPAIGSYVVWQCTVETLNVSAYCDIVILVTLHYIPRSQTIGVATTVFVCHLLFRSRKHRCKLTCLQGSTITIRKRYSEFDKLRKNLTKTFPLAGAALPELPPKSFMHRFQPKFLEKRKAGLAYFLK